MGKHTIIELEDLRSRLREAEETLAAIRNGEVDSLVVTGPHGDQVFSLKGAEQPYRVFVEQMLEGALTLSTDGIILYCNRRFAEMMHSRLEKVIGSSIQSFVRAADRTGLERILKESPATKATYTLIAENGVAIMAQLAFSRLPIDEIEGICVVVTDLTERQEMQELAMALRKLRAAQDQLQRQNDALVRARCAAETANEVKDNFLAALSHELRTPLTPVLMAAESLEADTSLPAPARRELAILRRNVELEARLIDDLLDVTRIVRGKIELRPTIVDVHALITSAVDICQSDISAKRMKMTQALGAARCHAHGDAVRLQQIIWNLLRNAVKFTPDGGQITIRSDNDGDMLTISITDTGIGIAPDAMERIFSPFEQAARAITQQFGGLGLGLAISKRLAELHGGTVIAESDGLNRGSTFTICLPTVLAPSVKLDIARPRPGNGNIRQLRILLVEDHEDTRDSLSRLLSRHHSVRDVPGMAAALKAASGETFDLLISDVGLPDGSGLELMRELHDRCDIKGICLSGFGMDEDIARSTEAGFAHHITKPVDFHRLESIIHSLAS